MSDEVVTLTAADVGTVEAAAFTRPAKAPRAAALKAELEAEKALLEPELAKYREVYDRLINAPELLEARAKIKAISAKLGPVLNELAALARAGGSKGIKAEAGAYAAKE